jgi:transcriptional regulator with XRE-family HTH domain
VDPDHLSDPGLRQLGAYIRLQRRMADLSLRRMAELTQVSNAYLSQVERGLHQPSIRVLRSIASALGVSADTLLAQAGLFDQAPPPDVEREPSTERVSTESAIAHDPALSPDDRETLLRLYRSLARRREPAD